MRKNSPRAPSRSYEAVHEQSRITSSPIRIAAAKLETFRVNGLMVAANEQAVGTKMGTVGQIN